MPILKANILVVVTKRLFRYKDTDKQLYKSPMNTHLEYTVWNPIKNGDVDLIEKVD